MVQKHIKLSACMIDRSNAHSGLVTPKYMYKRVRKPKKRGRGKRELGPSISLRGGRRRNSWMRWLNNWVSGPRQSLTLMAALFFSMTNDANLDTRNQWLSTVISIGPTGDPSATSPLFWPAHFHSPSALRFSASKNKKEKKKKKNRKKEKGKKAEEKQKKREKKNKEWKKKNPQKIHFFASIPLLGLNQISSKNFKVFYWYVRWFSSWFSIAPFSLFITFVY